MNKSITGGFIITMSALAGGFGGYGLGAWLIPELGGWEVVISLIMATIGAYVFGVVVFSTIMVVYGWNMVDEFR